MIVVVVFVVVAVVIAAGGVLYTCKNQMVQRGFSLKFPQLMKFMNLANVLSS